MALHGNVFTVSLSVDGFILFDDLFLLRMNGDDGCTVGKELLHGLRVIREEVPFLGKVEPIIGHGKQV